MNFARQRWGLILCAGLSLLLVIVPLWRMRVLQQWKSSTVDISVSSVENGIWTNKQSSQYGLSPILAQAAAQRFPEDVNAQLAQIDKGELLREYTTLQKQFLVQPYSTPTELAKVQVEQRRFMPRLWKLTDEYFAHYGNLEQRFPNSNLVRAQHLRDLMGGAIIADEGPQGSSEVLPVRAPTSGKVGPPPLLLRAEPWASTSTRVAALRTAQEGARREPNNAFFRWMAAVLCFSLSKNEDALRELEAAGRCSTFRDYGLPTVESRLDVLARMRTTGWEDDFAEYALSSFPHLSKMRSAARTAAGQIRLDRRQGNQNQAFRFAVATSRAGAVVARSGNSTLISNLVGQAVCSIVWRAAIEEEPNAPTPPTYSGSEQEQQQQSAAYVRQQAKCFASVARARRQNELASEIESLPQTFDGQKLSLWLSSNPSGIVPRVERLAGNYWLGSQLLRLAVVSAVLWCLCWMLTRRQHEEFTRARVQILVPTMFCVGATGALLVGAQAMAPPMREFAEWITGESASPSPPLAIAFLRNKWAFILGLLWAVFVVIATIRGRRSKEFVGSGAPKARLLRLGHNAAWSAFVGCILIIVYFSVVTVPQSLVTDVLMYIALIGVGTSALVGTALSVLRTTDNVRLLAIFAAGAFSLGAIGQMVGTGPDNEPFYGTVAKLVAALLALAALGLVARNWKSHALHVLQFMLELAMRGRIVTGTLALVGLVVYMGVTLWTIPVESNTRAYLHRLFVEGEVKVLREQIQQQE